jgi:hypothetical protein
MDQAESHASDLYLNVKGGEDDNDRGMWNKHEEVVRKWESDHDKAKLRKGSEMYMYFVVAWLVRYSPRNQGSSTQYKIVHSWTLI